VSVEPSSITTTSKSGAQRRMSRMTRATIPDSLKAGTIASFRREDSEAMGRPKA
jgi:hypothetical protein